MVTNCLLLIISYIYMGSCRTCLNTLYYSSTMAFMFPVRGYTHNIIICVDIQHVRQHVKLILIGLSLYLAHWE